MTGSAQVHLDTSEFRRLGAAISSLPAKLKGEIYRSALWHVAKKARTKVVRMAADYSGAPYREARKAASSRMTSDAVEFRFKSRWISLAALGARQTRSGVSVRGRGKYASAFIASSKISGGKAVMQRKGASRTPVRELYGMNVAHAVGEDRHDVFQRMVDELGDRDLAARVLHETERRLASLR